MAQVTANTVVISTLIKYNFFNVMNSTVHRSLCTILNSAVLLVMFQNEMHVQRHFKQCVNTYCLCKYKIRTREGQHRTGNRAMETRNEVI
jgi:hypothetical protein